MPYLLLTNRTYDFSPLLSDLLCLSLVISQFNDGLVYATTVTSATSRQQFVIDHNKYVNKFWDKLW